MTATVMMTTRMPMIIPAIDRPYDAWPRVYALRGSDTAELLAITVNT